MKKLSGKMKLLLVMAICAAMMVPSVASAGSTTLVPNAEHPEGIFETGHYTLDLPLTVNRTTTRVDLKVVNGDGLGDDVVSSVKITLLDETGKPKEVVISPNKFSQNMDKKKNVEFSTINGYFLADSVEDMDNFSLDIKVGGPKNSSITLTVIENWEGNGSGFPTGGGSRGF